MSKLLFFSRVALLCNICFVFAFLIRYVPVLKDGLFVSTIIVIGLVLSIVINILVNIFYVIITMSNAPVSRYVPRWLVATNFLFFVFQAILLIK
jgi:hypothetical protein